MTDAKIIPQTHRCISFLRAKAATAFSAS